MCVCNAYDGSYSANDGVTQHAHTWNACSATDHGRQGTSPSFLHLHCAHAGGVHESIFSRTLRAALGGGGAAVSWRNAAHNRVDVLATADPGGSQADGAGAKLAHVEVARDAESAMNHEELQRAFNLTKGQ